MAAHPLRRREHARKTLAGLIVGVDEHVFQHGHPGQRPRDLERAPDPEPRDGVGRQPVETIGAEADLAAVGPREAADHVEERRLARAVRTDETRDRAFGHGEGAAGEGLDAAEALGDAGDGEQLGRDRSPVARAPGSRRLEMPRSPRIICQTLDPRNAAERTW